MVIGIHNFVVDLRNTFVVTGSGDVGTLPSPGGSIYNCSHTLNHRICIVATVGKSSFLPFSGLDNVLTEGLPSTSRVAGLACSLWRSAQVDALAQPSF